MIFTRNDLENKIKELYGIDEINSLIEAQISKYSLAGYTYLDIARALYYYVEVQQGNINLKYGIAIAIQVMNESRRYFRKLEEQKALQRLQVQEVDGQKKVIVYKPEKRKDNKRKIDIESITEDNNE